MTTLAARLPLRQFGVFLLAGGGAAAANFATGALIRLGSQSALVLGASVVAGHTVGTIVSFFLHRRYTFAVEDEQAGPQAARYALVAVGGLLLAPILAEAVLWLWERGGSPFVSRTLAESAAHVAAIGVNTIYGFFAMKFFALKRRGPTES